MLKIGQPEANAAAKVILSGNLIRFLERKSGQLSECAKFEREFSEKMGTEYALVVTSGTGALICGLAGLGIGPGDEVVVPAYTFMATPVAVLAVGAVPVIAEIDESLMLDPADTEAKMTSRTKAIIPVHMVGLPANMNGIVSVASKHGVKVLEDACQADGGSYRGKRLGSIGDVGAYSFNYYKNITCGEGGAVVTNDPTVYERAMIQHDPGTAFRSHRADLSIAPFTGLSFRMNEILGAVLRVQLRRIDGLLAKLREQKAQLVDELAGTGLRLVKNNDPEGDCATVLALSFATEKDARRYISLLAKEGVDASTPIDSDRHVYSNWDPILAKRGAYHPALNAFQRPENATSEVEYSRDMCPRTLDLLSRAVFIDLHPDSTAAALRKKIDGCKRAADELATKQ
ncbi:MAG: DegT/DnrJ/EryC1/StrS family aminotransferase [Planctomycetota bacterium]|jgi:dTDP-4-amino-4,6-dideoxygalactose transaminase